MMPTFDHTPDDSPNAPCATCEAEMDSLRLVVDDDFGMAPEEFLLQERALRLCVKRGIPLERLRTTVMHATGQPQRPRRQTVQVLEMERWSDVFEVICEAPNDDRPVTVTSRWLIDIERIV